MRWGEVGRDRTAVKKQKRQCCQELVERKHEPTEAQCYASRYSMKGEYSGSMSIALPSPLKVRSVFRLRAITRVIGWSTPKTFSYPCSARTYIASATVTF